MADDGEILLVEDNPADAELILHSLAAASLAARILLVRDGAEALDRLFCRGEYADRSPVLPPRVVLLDVKLPKVDGLEVLRQVKAHSRTRGIPVVMLTSSSVERDVVLAYRLGANSYVQKPVDFERLRRVLVALGRYWLEVSEPPPARVFVPEQTG